MVQQIVVLGIVLIAALVVVRRLYRALVSEGGQGCGCSDCSPCQVQSPCSFDQPSPEDEGQKLSTKET